AFARASGASSQRQGTAPPAVSAAAVASPDRPSPSTATLRPSNPCTGIMTRPFPSCPRTMPRAPAACKPGRSGRHPVARPCHNPARIRSRSRSIQMSDRSSGKTLGVSMVGLVGRRLRAARRLILFATLMAFAAGVIGFLRHDITVHGVPLPLFTGLLTATVVGVAATLTSVLLPALAAFVEATAIARLAAAVAAFGHPEFGTAMQQSPLLAATVVVGGALVIRRLTTHPGAREWSVIASLRSRHIAA